MCVSLRRVSLARLPVRQRGRQRGEPAGCGSLATRDAVAATRTPRGATCPRRLPGAVATCFALPWPPTPSTFAPTATAPPLTPTAATTAAALSATPPARSPPLDAAVAPRPPNPAETAPAPVAVAGTVAAEAVPGLWRPFRSVRETGIGMRRSPRSALRCPFWSRAKLAQSGHSARWSRRRRRSFLPRRPSTDCEIANCASVHVNCCSSSSASERRARKRSVSSAEGRDAQNPGDLGIRATFELAEDDRLALLGRDLREGGQELADARAVVVLDLVVGDAIVQLDLPRACRVMPEPLLDRVARDREEPVRRLARTDALLDRAVGVEERRLGDVLGVRMISENCVGVPIDVAAVAAVQVVHLA